MPYRNVNGARLFYRSYGKPSTGEPPVLLIHGATSDGATDWAALAPVLGLRHHVIMLDCRGHGRSTNPLGGYSFRQLAEDAAGLVGALGYERAHIVGHSNGGNVALVTLVEHPEIVATCVVQAGNAFVSPDIVEKEPATFDPDRVARDWPAWRDRMIRLHGRWQGQDYWRELLKITVAEIVAAPNYKPRDLRRVDRPTLVIEGQQDRVNAASRHGEFIARHIPDAELWRPEGVGHSVHEERPAEWLIKLEDFWQRRGSRTRDRLWRLSGGGASDPLSTVFSYAVDADRSGEVARVTVLEAGDVERVQEAVGPDAPIEWRVLADTSTKAVVTAGVVDLMQHPVDGARMTQGLFGESAQILDVRGTFARIRLAADGYIGWAKSDAFEPAGPDLQATSHYVWADYALARNSPGGEIVGRLPFRSALRAATQRGSWLGIRARGSALWWVSEADVRPQGEGLPVAAVLGRLQAFVGVPYLWGGRTPWGFDCSGMAQAFLAELGRPVPRDTDQQWQSGEAVAGSPEPGDLVFFGDHTTDQPDRVAHVGIALGEGHFLHAWGASSSVTITSLSGREARSSGLRSAFLGARRYGS